MTTIEKGATHDKIPLLLQLNILRLLACAQHFELC